MGLGVVMGRGGELAEEVAEQGGLGLADLLGWRGFDALESTANDFDGVPCNELPELIRVGLVEGGENFAEQPLSFPRPPNLSVIA